MRKEVNTDEEVDLSLACDGFGNQFGRNWDWVQSEGSASASSQRGGETR
jgi:hypothetical protein